MIESYNEEQKNIIDLKADEKVNNLKNQKEQSEFTFIYDRNLMEMNIKKIKTFAEFQIATINLLKRIDNYLK